MVFLELTLANDLVDIFPDPTGNSELTLSHKIRRSLKIVATDRPDFKFEPETLPVMKVFAVDIDIDIGIGIG